jgi:hypothetical protein
MPTDPDSATLAQIVQRAVAVCDPAGEHEAVADLSERFEDSDEPITAVGDIGSRMAEAGGVVDPDGLDPAVAMTTAVTVYLAHRRDHADDDREDVLRLAARNEFDGRPPAHVADWLAAQGVDL